jgi:hypothetical protein
MNKRKTIGVAILVAALMVVSIFCALPSTVNAAANLSVGDIVEVFNTGSEGLLVLDAPCGETSGGEFDGDAGIILGGPEYCYGHNRWLIRWSDDSLEGWSAEDWLRKKDISPSTKFSVGDRVKVYNTGDSGLVVRTDPPELARKTKIYDGKEGTVKDGPFYGAPEGKTGFYHFWEVDYGDDTVGWSAEDWLCLVEVVDTTPPTITISSPSSGETFITPTITVTGTASDDVAVSKVEVKVGSGSWQTTSGTTSWSVQVTLSSGSNTIYAKATDTSGNTKENSVVVNYNPPDTTPPTILIPQKYKLSPELEKIVFNAIKYVEVGDRSIHTWEDKFEEGSYGPCQIRKIAVDDANLPFREIEPKFDFEKVIQNEQEYRRFVLTYSSVILRDYLGINPQTATLEDLEHIILAWVNPSYYKEYYSGNKPPLEDYQKRLGRLEEFLSYKSPTPTTPTPTDQPEETPQPEEPKQNQIQEVIEKIQENIPPIQTVIEKIQGIIDKIRSLFGF